MYVHLLVQWVSREVERRPLLDETTALARTDDLTGSATRRTLFERVRVGRLLADGEPSSVTCSVGEARTDPDEAERERDD